MFHASRLRLLPAVLFLSSLLISGCAASYDAAPAVSVQAASVQGTVFGGEQPIVGAKVYAYAAGTSGYNTAASSIINLGAAGVTTDSKGVGYVTTDANGKWTIHGDITCPSPSSLIYFFAAGGNPGSAAAPNNTAIGELAAFGPCSNLSSSSVIHINELTTVAGMSALAPFFSPTLFSFSTSATNVAGLTHAFTTANNLVSVSTGTVNATTPSGLGTIPVAEINTLADALATCVNSTGVGGNCATLFAATAVGGVQPTSTATAMYNITTHPTLGTTALYNLATPTPPYTPILPVGFNAFTNSNSGIPNDWSLAIVYRAPNLNAPTYLAIDSQDNVWAAGGNRTALQFSNAGALTYSVVSTTNQLSGNNYNQVLSVDLNDTLWTDNNSYGVTPISSTGVLLDDPTAPWGYEPGPGSNYNISTDYVSGYGGVAIAPNGNILIGSAANNSSALVVASSTGFGLADYMGGGLTNPIFIAVDGTGNYWLANQGGSCCSPKSVVVFGPTGTVLSGASGYAVGGQPSAIGFDASGRAWVTNYADNTLTVLSSAGAPLLGGPLNGGGVSGPSDLVVDGAGNVWVSNFGGGAGGNGISEFSSTGTVLSPTLGFYPGVASARCGAVGVDSSGNVWTANWTGGTINENVGIAAPTINPIVKQAKFNTFGMMP